jgi:hypothetical protein
MMKGKNEMDTTREQLFPPTEKEIAQAREIMARKTEIDRNAIFEMLLPQLDATYSLNYVDYRDNLDEQFAGMQERLAIGDFYILDEMAFHAYGWDTLSNARQVIDELVGELDADTDGKDNFEGSDQYFQLVYTVEERNDSDVLKDLIRNTSDQWITYLIDGSDSIGYEERRAERSDSQDWTPEEFDENEKQLLGDLGVELTGENSGAWQKWAQEILANATYGGSLRCLWYGDPFAWADALDLINVIKENGVLTLPAGAEVGIIDYWNGSGHTAGIPFSVSMIVKRGNFELDKMHNYDYAGTVCGLSSEAFDVEPTLVILPKNQATHA